MTKTVSSSYDQPLPIYTTGYSRKLNGSVVSGSDFGNSVKPVSKSRTGVNNPRWASQIRMGLNASTDLSATSLKVSWLQGHYHLTRHVKTLPTSPPTAAVEESFTVVQVPNPSVPSTTFLSTAVAVDRARQDFYKKARKAQRKFQSGPFIGELIETLEMIRRPAKLFRHGVSGFLSSVKKQAKGLNILHPSPQHRAKARKIISETWLENAFGWQPLLHDIDDGAQALALLSERAVREYTIVRGQGSESVQTVSTTGSTNIGSTPSGFGTSLTGWTGSFITNEISEASVRYYGAVRLADPFNSSAAFNNRLLGVTLSDIVPTVWELIPWSFLIDYFTNIGNVLEALSFNKSDILWSSRTLRQVNTRKSVVTLKPGLTSGSLSNTWVVTGESSTPSWTATVRKKVVREASSPVGLPSFHFRLPFYPNHWINIGALISARRRGPR